MEKYAEINNDYIILYYIIYNMSITPLAPIINELNKIQDVKKFQEEKNKIIQIIREGSFDPDEKINQDNEDYSILMILINLIDKIRNSHSEETKSVIKAFTDISIELIKSGKFNFSYEDEYGMTPLIFACFNYVDEIALALIEEGSSYPDNALILAHVDDNGDTALTLACQNKMNEVALKLIETGNSNPANVNYDGNTALILACKNNMNEVALKLIETGNSNPEKMDRSGKTALMYAKSNNMRDVVKILQDDIKVIDINQEGFDAVKREHQIIKDYLKEDNENICFELNNNYYLLNLESLKVQVKNSINIKYACLEAGEDQDYVEDDNIDYSTPYFTLSSVTGLQILVLKSDIDNIISNKFSANLYSLSPSNIKLVSIISQSYIDGEGGVGTDNCQEGKSREVYKITKAVPFCSLDKLNTSSEIETHSKSEEPEEKIINIQYKGYKLPFQVTIDTTLGELKEMLLNELVKKELIEEVKNKKVRIIYSGRILTDDSIKLSEIENPPFGITFQASVTEAIPTGGRKTIKRIKLQKNKSKNLLKKYRRNKSKKILKKHKRSKSRKQ